MRIASLIVIVLLLSVGSSADAAKRLGGAKPVGKQSANVAQRDAAPAPPAAAGTTGGSAQSATAAATGVPAGTAAAANKATAPIAPPGAPATAPKRPWAGMLGGLAAGLGLAWLAHSLGLGEAFGQFLLLGVAVLVGMVLIGWWMRRKSGAVAQSGAPFAYQGAAAAAAGAGVSPASYRPENVGNDASARPFERTSLFQDLGTNPGSPMVKVGSALGGTQGWDIPKDFDSAGFLSAAKSNFVNLQAAWDRADLATLRAMMTDAMLAEIKSQLDARESHTGGAVNLTDVVMIDAQLLGIEDLGDDYMASVEFSGMIREDASAGPNPFREVWNMTKPKSGRTGWLVAGVQALQ